MHIKEAIKQVPLYFIAHIRLFLMRVSNTGNGILYFLATLSESGRFLHKFVSLLRKFVFVYAEYFEGWGRVGFAPFPLLILELFFGGLHRKTIKSGVMEDRCFGRHLSERRGSAHRENLPREFVKLMCKCFALRSRR